MSGPEHSNPQTSERPSAPTRSRAHLKAAAVAGAVALAGAAVIGALSVAGDVGQTAASEAATPSPTTAAPVAAPPSPLEVDHALHEFGDVPIDGGVVEATFEVTNAGDDPTAIVAAYTSCMCTEAMLGFPDGTTEGPFGMPGHELPVTLDRELGAAETVTMTVRFDPGAHGPEATGPVERGVILHTADGAAMTVRLTANVVAD